MRSPLLSFSRLSTDSGELVYFGGLDASKFSTAQGFSDYFRVAYDPNNDIVVPLANIIDYETDSDGNGRLNVIARINIRFSVPNSVFSNRDASESGTRLRYIVDPSGLIQNVGNRSFSNNPLQYILLRNMTDLAGQFIEGAIAEVLSFEELTTLGALYFQSLRNGIDRLNIRNADQFIEDPANDTVLLSYNLNNDSTTKKIIYLDPSMQTINAGQPFATLATAISRGAIARYVTDKTPPASFSPGDISIYQLGTGRVKLVINEPAAINTFDFYEIFVTRDDQPDDVIARFFPKQELSDVNEWIRGLEPATNYKLSVRAVDLFYNKNTASTPIDVITPAINPIFLNITAYFYLDELSGDIYDAVSGNAVGNVTPGTDQTSAGIITNNVNEYVVIPHKAVYNLSDGVTNKDCFLCIDGMLLTDNPDGDIATLTAKRSGTAIDEKEWQLIYQEVTQELIFTLFFTDNTFLLLRTVHPMILGTEYRAVVNIDGANVSVYIDTNLVLSGTIPAGKIITQTDVDITIGLSFSSISRQAYGKFRNFGISTTSALTAQQIIDLGTANSIVY